MTEPVTLVWGRGGPYIYRMHSTPTGKLTISKYMFNESTKQYDIKDKEHSRTIDPIKGANWWYDYVKQGHDIPTEERSYDFFDRGPKERKSVDAKSFGWQDYKTDSEKQRSISTLSGLEKMPYSPTVSRERKVARSKTEYMPTELYPSELNIRALRQKYPDSSIVIKNDELFVEEPVTSDITIPASEVMEPSISLPWQEGTSSKLKEEILNKYKERIYKSEREKINKMSSLEKEFLDIEDEEEYLIKKVNEKLGFLEGKFSEEELPSLKNEKLQVIKRSWIPYEDLSPRDKNMRQNYIHDLEETFRKMSPVELDEQYVEAVELGKMTPREAWEAMRYKLRVEGSEYSDEEWDFITTIGLVGYPEEYLPTKQQKEDPNFDWSTYYNKYGKVFDAVSGDNYYERQSKRYNQQTKQIEKTAEGPWNKKWDEEYLKMKEEDDASKIDWEDIYREDLKNKLNEKYVKAIESPTQAEPSVEKEIISVGGYWKEVEDGEVFPLGLQFKMDLDTGKNYVWIEKEEEAPFEEKDNESTFEEAESTDSTITQDEPISDEELTRIRMEGKTLGYYDPRITGYSERLTELSEVLPEETRELDIIETGREEWIPYGRGGGYIEEFIEEPIILEKGKSIIDEESFEEPYYFDPEFGMRQAYLEKYKRQTKSTSDPNPKIIVPGSLDPDLNVWEKEDYSGLEEF